ncbi:MAG TPA: hypothetical protein VGP03_02300 [Pseudonocardiaceae bacterium]|nr:hypothetical protein [Pseudonocardiaceae bacterium]
MANGASGLPLYTLAPTVKTRKKVPISSTTSFRPVPWAAATFVDSFVALLAVLGVKTSMTATIPLGRAHVVTANAHLRSRSAGIRAYLLPAKASIRLPELPGAQHVSVAVMP